MDRRRKKRRVEGEEERTTVDPSPGAPEALPDLVNFVVNRGDLRESRAIYRQEMEK